MQDHDISAVLARAAKVAGFSISDATIEAEGLRGNCHGATTGRVGQSSL